MFKFKAIKSLKILIKQNKNGWKAVLNGLKTVYSAV
jgi:hypothetical protein